MQSLELLAAHTGFVINHNRLVVAHGAISEGEVTYTLCDPWMSIWAEDSGHILEMDFEILNPDFSIGKVYNIKTDKTITVNPESLEHMAAYMLDLVIS